MTKDCTQPLRRNLRPAQTTKEGHSLKGLGIDLDLNWTEMSCYHFLGPNELGTKNEVADFFFAHAHTRQVSHFRKIL